MADGSVTLLKLTRSPRDENRFYAEFDNGDAFSVTVMHIADYSLYTGAKIPTDRYRTLSIAAEKSRARARAMRILGARMLSKGEIVEKLLQKGERQEVCGDTAEYLESIGAINDQQYAQAIVLHYAKKGYGAGKIRNELYRRRIPKDMWEDAMQTMPDTEESIDRLIASKLAGKICDRKEIKKVSDMLIRRGYSYDEIRSGLRKYADGNED